ncbi:MAG TPA: hypothetical protein VH370_00920 [Humisphaera sp.]|nr:hypothetical protein [Humisphaera sp.]
MAVANADIVSEAMAYEAPFLIEKLLKEQIVATPEEAQVLFSEVKRYIILVYLDEKTSWEMYSRRIDEVWHQFVLYTREYTDFSNRFFGRYIHHSPGNAPESTPTGAARGSFEGFKARYGALFGVPLPSVWHDEANITTYRRVINHNVGGLTLRDGDGMIDLLDSTGNTLLSINELAREALAFICRTGAFYVRELPGALADEEKVALIETLVEYKLLRTGS